MSQIRIHPKIVLLIDSVGALVTVIFLAVVIRTFNQCFGMPGNTLLLLAGIAFLFCIYSFSCFLFIRERWTPFLKGISIANLLYCCLTFTLVIYFWSSLTLLGILYFFAEMAIILALVYIELLVMRNWENEQ
jgi:hypothetical protein